MPGHTERDFENAIEAGLVNTGGYEKRRPNAFDEALALFPGDVTGFLRRQPIGKVGIARGPSPVEDRGDRARRPVEGAGRQGHTARLRHGFKCYGKTFRMAYFRPNTTMNPEGSQGLRQEPADDHAPSLLQLGH